MVSARPAITSYRFVLEHSLGEVQATLFDLTPTGWLPQLYLRIDLPDSQCEGVVSSPLLNLIKVYQAPATKGRYAWQPIELLEQPSRIIVPDSKQAGLIGNDPREEIHSKMHNWMVVKLLDKDAGFSSLPVKFYGQVAHLEETRLLSQKEIVMRATMERLKLNGHRIEDHYDISDPAIRQVYLESIDIPFVKDIPPEYRGKHLSVAELSSLRLAYPSGLPFRSPLANPAPC